MGDEEETKTDTSKEPPLSFRSNFYRTQRGVAVPVRPYQGANKYAGGIMESFAAKQSAAVPVRPYQGSNQYSGGFMESFAKQQRENRKGNVDNKFARGGPSPVMERAPRPAPHSESSATT